MNCCGFDVGTFTLVSCCRDKGEFDYSQEINAFIEIPLEDRFVFNMIKTSKESIPSFERGKSGYVLGEAAVKVAYTMNQMQLRRPMQEGCVNPKEKDSFEILNIMIHSMLDGIVKADNTILYYSVPANALNKETDANYHSKVLESIFNAYKSEEGFKVKPYPINEGLALIYSELKDKNYTGIAISFGGGMCNLCFAVYGVPVFKFALVDSGDWLDKMAAKSCGESPAFINREKMKVSLLKSPTNLAQRAIITQYKLLIESVISNIKKGLSDSDKKARLDEPIDIVIAGGTSIIDGFDVVFKEVLKQADLPINVGNIIKPKDPLLSVSKGCLLAAESSIK